LPACHCTIYYGKWRQFEGFKWAVIGHLWPSISIRAGRLVSTLPMPLITGTKLILGRKVVG